MRNTTRGAIAVMLLGGVLVLQGCQLIGGGPHRGAPTPAPVHTTTVAAAGTQTDDLAREIALRAKLVTLIKADVDWTASPVTKYGDKVTHNAGWFAQIPGTGTQCGWETRGSVGAFCTSDGGASVATKGIADWGTVDGHKQCAALIGDTSFVFCRDGYRTTS